MKQSVIQLFSLAPGTNHITRLAFQIFPICNYRVNQAYQNVRHLTAGRITGWIVVSEF